MASAMPDLLLPSQAYGVTASWLVPIYTAWWQEVTLTLAVTSATLLTIDAVADVSKQTRLFYPVLKFSTEHITGD